MKNDHDKEDFKQCRITYKNGDIYNGYIKYGIQEGIGNYLCSTSNKFYQEYKGEFKSNNFDGQGFQSYKNGDTYEGQFKNDLKHGYGVINYSDTTNSIRKYEGFYKDGKSEGQGKLWYKNGDLYEGNFKQNYPDGQGTYTYNPLPSEIEDQEFLVIETGYESDQGDKILTNQKTFKGNFQKGKRSGNGKLFFKDGSSLEGKWKNGKRLTDEYAIYNFSEDHESILKIEGKFSHYKSLTSEQIKVYYKNGDFYEGGILDFEYDGFGVYKYSANHQEFEKYTGHYKENKRNGTGIMIYKNKDVYNGIWLNNLREGEAVFKFSPDNIFGDYYEGEYKFNFRHGNGKLVLKDGQTYTGKWQNGSIDTTKDKATIVFAQNQENRQIKYIGNIKDYLPNFQGKMFYQNGDVYEGNQKNGKKHNKGVYYFCDKDPVSLKYDGEFCDNQFSGFGKMYYKDGEVIVWNQGFDKIDTGELDPGSYELITNVPERQGINEIIQKQSTIEHRKMKKSMRDKLQKNELGGGNSVRDLKVSDSNGLCYCSMF